jgi:methylase of polypeptide subunit release factors
MFIAYLLPNDEKENDRLDIFHHLMGIVNGGKLHRAPVKNPHRILDIGTGTGIWAMQMSEVFLRLKGVSLY